MLQSALCISPTIRFVFCSDKPQLALESKHSYERKQPALHIRLPQVSELVQKDQGALKEQQKKNKRITYFS